MWPEGIFMMASVSPWHSPVILRAVPSFLAISDILILLLAPARGLKVFAPLKGNGFRRQDLHLRSLWWLWCHCVPVFWIDAPAYTRQTHTCIIYLSSTYRSPSVHPHLYPFIYLYVFEYIYPSNYSSFHPLIYSHIYSFSSIYHPSIHLSICVSSFPSIHPPIHPHIISLFTCGLIHPSVSQSSIPPCVPIYPFVCLSIIYQSMYLYVRPPT